MFYLKTYHDSEIEPVDEETAKELIEAFNTLSEALAQFITIGRKQGENNTAFKVSDYCTERLHIMLRELDKVYTVSGVHELTSN